MPPPTITITITDLRPAKAKLILGCRDNEETLEQEQKQRVTREYVEPFILFSIFRFSSWYYTCFQVFTERVEYVGGSSSSTCRKSNASNSDVETSQTFNQDLCLKAMSPYRVSCLQDDSLKTVEDVQTRQLEREEIKALPVDNGPEPPTFSTRSRRFLTTTIINTTTSITSITSTTTTTTITTII
ncbi:hypothetical protein V1478_017785, partial [Vespula squamosa]